LNTQSRFKGLCHQDVIDPADGSLVNTNSDTNLAVTVVLDVVLLGPDATSLNVNVPKWLADSVIVEPLMDIVRPDVAFV